MPPPSGATAAVAVRFPGTCGFRCRRAGDRQSDRPLRSAQTLASMAERSSGAGDRRDRDVAEALAGRHVAERGKRSSSRGSGESWDRATRVRRVPTPVMRGLAATCRSTSAQPRSCTAGSASTHAPQAMQQDVSPTPTVLLRILPGLRRLCSLARRPAAYVWCAPTMLSLLAAAYSSALDALTDVAREDHLQRVPKSRLRDLASHPLRGGSRLARCAPARQPWRHIDSPFSERVGISEPSIDGGDRLHEVRDL